MLGLMQDRPLLISSLIDHAAAFHGATEIVTRTVEGPIVRSHWAGIRRRAKQVANALAQLGIAPGDRVATLAWNTYRHLELYYGVSGSGAVLHTVNPRLFPEQIDYIVNHAEDKVLFFDIGLAPLVAKLAPAFKTVTTFVAMTDRAHMPDVALPNLLCYEELVGAQSEAYVWPEFDERSASSLCYTSGTTGNPKGVLYSHRSTVLHTLMQISSDGFGIHPGTSLLLIVPMFHANAWGVPYAAAMTGAKMVMPGPHLDGQNLYELMRDEHVTLSQGVPTVWMLFLQFLDAHPEIDPSQLDIERICCGGSATPRAMIDRLERDFGADWMQGWGMTETSPLGTIGTLLPKHAGLSAHDRTTVKLKQGRGIWGVELKIVGADGRVQPHDGVAFGHLHVRGPWVAKAYFKGEGGDVLDADGFFPTGDIATIDADGYVQLVDRAKDVIKSGGEWISSIELEDAANGHPAVAEAAIIGIPHPTWQERPLLVVVKRAGHEVTREALLDFLATRVAKWWLPDDVVFVAQLPHTATGKLLKTKLREQFREHRLGQGVPGCCLVSGPLAGLKVVEMAGLGPGPFCAMLLADMGAQVIRIERPSTGAAPIVAAPFDVTARGRPAVALDLRQPAATETVLELIGAADALIEGFRPGVMERLGLGPDPCLARNPRLVYGRMTGWGQHGPLAKAAGHDINYIALSGVLNAVGLPDAPPVPPLNLVGDYGGGAMVLAFGILCALHEAQRSGRGQVVDAAMTDGAALLAAMVYGLKAGGAWSNRRGENLLDGGAPFYATYACADGKHVAVGAIEPQFYAELLARCGIDDPAFAAQNDTARWPDLKRRLAGIFRTRTRDAWCAMLEGSDACFAPVLDWDEAPQHPHNRAREAFVTVDGVLQPSPAPRFSRTPAGVPTGRGTTSGEDALRDWGIPPERIDSLKASNAL